MPAQAFSLAGFAAISSFSCMYNGLLKSAIRLGVSTTQTGAGGGFPAGGGVRAGGAWARPSKSSNSGIAASASTQRMNAAPAFPFLVLSRNDLPPFPRVFGPVPSEATAVGLLNAHGG